MITITDLRNVDIPDCIYLTMNYETAFENEVSPLKLIVPTNTQELYDMMLATPNLCGKFEMTENGDICWDLYDDFKIKIVVDSRDCYFGILKKTTEEFNSEITHWHPMNFEVYDDVCKIGAHGNVLVIRASAFGENVLYKGSETECPYSPEGKTIFGRTYYLKVK